MDMATATRVCVKVYKYVMNGVHTGHLYLHRNHQVQWHSRATDRITVWHGEWYTTHDGRGIIVKFDYTAVHSNQICNKWTWLKGMDGIDYMARWIRIEFVRHYTSEDGGISYTEMPLPIEDIKIQTDEWEVLPSHPFV